MVSEDEPTPMTLQEWAAADLGTVEPVDWAGGWNAETADEALAAISPEVMAYLKRRWARPARKHWGPWRSLVHQIAKADDRRELQAAQRRARRATRKASR